MILLFSFKMWDWLLENENELKYGYSGYETKVEVKIDNVK